MWPLAILNVASPAFPSVVNRLWSVSVPLALVILLALSVLNLIAWGGLIGGIRIADDCGVVSFRQAWQVGARFFWRFLGISLLLWLLLLVPTLTVAALIEVTSLTSVVGVLSAGLFLILYMLVTIVLAIVAQLAQFAVVLEDVGVTEAYRRGWAVLRTVPGSIVIVFIVLAVVSMIGSAVVEVPVFALSIPSDDYTLVVEALEWWLLVSIPSVDHTLVVAALEWWLLVIWVPLGILNTWNIAAWTLLYRQVTHGKPYRPATLPLPAAPPPVMPPAGESPWRRPSAP